jgi:hypothetical protein
MNIIKPIIKTNHLLPTYVYMNREYFLCIKRGNIEKYVKIIFREDTNNFVRLIRDNKLSMYYIFI